MSARKKNIFQKASCGLLILCVFAASACQNKEELNQQAAFNVFNEWATQNQSQGSDSCHAYGLIKHPETTCEEMLQHAQKVIHDTRALSSRRSLECFDSVCGEFIELEMESKDSKNRSVKEIAVLKNDNDTFRLYWYRTNSLLTVINERTNILAKGTSNLELEAKQEQLDRTYAYLTNKIPELYQFPACLGTRITSSNLIGNLMPLNSVTLSDFVSRSKKCDKVLCIGMIGKKVAAVCDKVQ